MKDPNPAPEGHSTRLPRILKGRYRLLGRCGQGGMATVYRARDLETTKTVAIKVMPVPEDWGRLQREVSTLRRIRHPNVVRYIDFYMDDAYAAIVMEYLPGETLSKYLQPGRVMPWPWVLRLAREVLEGLAPIHDAGFIHRDVKPANIILLDAQEPRLKLFDFGVVKPVTQKLRRITETGLVLGTPTYMAPEQYAGEDLGQSVDVYALGVVLWQALTGLVPQGGVLFVPHWPQETGDPPAHVREFIETMVRAVPRWRHPNARQCLMALHEVVHGAGCPTLGSNRATIELVAS